EVLDGRGQCLEQSVAQGSASVALAGTAHKIKIEPEVLDFGIVFVGNSKDRKLTIKNEGVTNVTLEPTITYPENPFQVIKPLDSLVLSPSQSAEVTIRFQPAGSGAYTEELSLFIGSIMWELSVRGRAYTEEELMARFQAHIETDREVCQAAQAAGQNPRALFLPSDNLDGIFYGFQCLTSEQLRGLVQFMMSEDWRNSISDLSPDPDIIPLPGGFWDYQHFLQALQYLVNAGESNFNEAYNTIRSGGFTFSPTFQTFVDTLTLMTQGGYTFRIGPFSIPISSDPLLGNDPARQAVGALVNMLRANPQLLGQLGQLMQQIAAVLPVVPGLLVPVPGLNIHSQIAINQVTFLYTIARVWTAAGSMHYQSHGLTATLAVHFVGGLNTALASGQDNAVLAAFNIANEIISFKTRLFGSNEVFANNVAKVVTLGNLVRGPLTQQWQIQWFPGLRQLAHGNPPPGLDFVATKEINGRLTAGFIHVQAKLGPDEVIEITNILIFIAEMAYLATQAGDPQSYGGVRGADGVAIMIAYNSDQETINRLVQRLTYANVNAPIVIIWIDNQGVVHATGVCGRQGCPDGKNAQDYANSIAQALGFAPGQPFEGSPLGSTGVSFEFLASLWADLLFICAGDINCAMYHFEWWLEHYSCVSQQLPCK
ncbi:MAG: hypothetical protein QXS96_08455, partial [Candidatus Caldarchaeum sp.]